MTSWVEISRKRLADNLKTLQRIVKEESSSDRELEWGEPTALLAVVKANAYGHCIDPCAAILAQAGAEWLGVTDASEGAALCGALNAARVAEQKRPQILVMCGTAALAGEAELIVNHQLVPVVWSASHIRRLSNAAREAGISAPVKVHLEIDSGMSRQGAKAGKELEEILRCIRNEPSIGLDGLMTHFASTEVVHSTQTKAQQEQFEAAVEQVVAAGMQPKWLHAGNSSFIDNSAATSGHLGHSMRWLCALAHRAGARSMVRSGLALYGYLLPMQGNGDAVATNKVLPVMTWKTRIIGLSEVLPGAAIGYNRTYVAERAMRLALLPVGYANGFRRELSSSSNKAGGWVMVQGECAPVVGRVSMNLLTVDVSGIEGVREGDEAVLLGNGITADDHARVAGTIPYEILCGVRASAKQERTK